MKQRSFEKLTVAQLVKKLTEFYRNRRFINVFVAVLKKIVSFCKKIFFSLVKWKK